MWMETVSKPEGDAQKCPTCGGGVHRRPLCEMHAGSFIRDGERVEISKRPCPEYADPIWLDPITQYFDGKLYRLFKGEKYFSCGGKKMHRAVWQSAFGDIPSRCHIHHRDGNPSNNSIANLECMDGGEHRTMERTREAAGKTEHFSDLARERAADWHASDEGRLWHKRHAERSKTWLKWKRVKKDCPVCGDEFDALVRKGGHAGKFCGPNCRATNSRRKRKGLKYY